MIEGRIINLNGGVYKVLTKDGVISIKARGKLRSKKMLVNSMNNKSNKKVLDNVKDSPKVGDIVLIENDMIDSYLPRKNSLVRPDIANVDQILLIFASKEPDFSFYLLDLFILNVTKNNIKPVIIITKKDLLTDDELDDLKNKLNYYKDNLNIDTYYVNSLKGDGIKLLEEILKDKVSILSGQTGAGKSSLINALIPDFNLKTQEISEALGRGKHTTREISLYSYLGGFIGDTPGFSKLEAIGFKLEDMNDLFVDFKKYKCKFKNCNHKPNSLGCGIIEAVNNKEILESRYNSYLKLYKELDK